MTGENMRREVNGSSMGFPNLLAAISLLATLAVASGCDQPQGVKVGAPPSVSGSDIHGEYVTLDRFKGSVVVLYFWTNSCCADELKELQPFYGRNRQRGLAVLAINERDTKEIVESYAKRNGLTFTFQTDEHAMTANDFRIIGFPTIFILDRSGIVRERILGHIPIAQLEKLVSRYL